MKSTGILLAIGIMVVMALTAALVLLGPGTSQHSIQKVDAPAPATPPAAVPMPPANETAPPPRPEYPQEPEAAPDPPPRFTAASLLGTESDGLIEFDERGRLLINLALRQRFDYLLSAIGETGLEQIRRQFQADLRRDFSDQQAARVLLEFDLYTDYLRAVDELWNGRSDTFRAQFNALQDLQQDLLGPQRASAWFGDENAYLERTLSIREGDLEAGEPGQDPWSGDINTATGHHLALEMNRQYEQLSLGPELRFAERSAVYGSEAAERLAALDAERAAWQARVEAYAAERRNLLESPGLDPAEIERLLAMTRQREFSEAEQRRILALENTGLLETDKSGDP